MPTTRSWILLHVSIDRLKASPNSRARAVIWSQSKFMSRLKWVHIMAISGWSGNLVARFCSRRDLIWISKLWDPTNSSIPLSILLSVVLTCLSGTRNRKTCLSGTRGIIFPKYGRGRHHKGPQKDIMITFLIPTRKMDMENLDEKS